MEGDHFVLASGSWSAQLAKVLDVNLPLKPIKGQMCRLKLDDHFFDYTIHGMMTYIARNICHHTVYRIIKKVII